MVRRHEILHSTSVQNIFHPYYIFHRFVDPSSPLSKIKPNKSAHSQPASVRGRHAQKRKSKNRGMTKKQGEGKDGMTESRVKIAKDMYIQTK